MEKSGVMLVVCLYMWLGLVPLQLLISMFDLSVVIIEMLWGVSFLVLCIWYSECPLNLAGISLELGNFLL